MTREAFIQGENHASQRDARRLYEHYTDETDALFIEGRSDTIQLEHHTLGYILFLIGYLSVELLYRIIYLLSQLIPNRESWSIKAAAREDGLAVDGEIDAELHEIWDQLTKSNRRFSYAFSIILYSVGILFITLESSNFTTLSRLVPTLEPSDLVILTRIMPAMVVAIVPFLFTYSIIFVLGEQGARDKIMAQAIIEKSNQEDFDEVLVLCGDKHVPGIKQHLESMGWIVNDERSSYRLLGFLD